MALLVCVLPFPTRINKTFQATELDVDDPQYAESREVRLDGWYFRYLFRRNTFKERCGTFRGAITIPGVLEKYDENYDIVKDVWNLSFMKAPFDCAVLAYGVYRPKVDFVRVGDVFVRENFDDMLIAFYGEEGTGTIYSGKILAAPAEDRGEGSALLDEYIKKFSWLKMGLEDGDFPDPRSDDK